MMGGNLVDVDVADIAAWNTIRDRVSTAGYQAFADIAWSAVTSLSKSAVVV